jgi:hypothetical protein
MTPGMRRSPPRISSTYRNAIFIANNRVVFNTKGNRHRLIATIQYQNGIAYIRFIGSHKEYETIEAAAISSEEETMEIKPIKTETDYQAALKEIERLFAAVPDTPEGDRLEVLTTLGEAYAEVLIKTPRDPLQVSCYRRMRAENDPVFRPMFFMRDRMP